MSAPSFSSFPVSFSSFPELDPGPSNKQSETPKPEREKKRKHEVSSRNKDKDRRKGRSKSRDREERKDRDKLRERNRKKDKERESGRSRERRKEGDKGKEKDNNKEQDRERKSRHKHRDREDRDRGKHPSKSSLVGESGTDQKFELDFKNHAESYRLYFIDTKGDPLTLQYGGLYAGSLPRYRLHRGGRQILGLSNSWAVYRRSDKGIEVGPKGTQKLVGLSDSSTRSLLALAPKPLLPQTAPSSKYEEIDGVIRLPTRRGRKDPEDSYRAITTSRDANSDSELSSSSAEGESEGETSDSSLVLSSHQLTIKNLEQELSNNPAAVDKWLSLLNHTLSTVPLTSRNANKARAEIAVSVLSRALSADSRNSLSKLLQLRYMKSGEEIWPENKLRAEWEKALKVGETEIWMEWLEWRIRSCTKGAEGLVEDVLRVYAALEGDGSETGQLAKLRVFWRVTVAFKAAGFTERAMAMFQAQAEFTFKVPQDLTNAPLEDRLADLEEFWDSENPRVGEEGARGWNKWHASGKPDATATPGAALLARDTESATQLDPYRQWAFQETQQDLSCLLPAKSLDEVAEADPYSMVLFSDLRMFLFEAKHPNARSALRLAWLSFLGLQVPGFASSLTHDREVNWDDRWNMGYLTNLPRLDAIFPSESNQKLVTAGAAAGVLVGREKEYVDSFGNPVREWQNGVMGCLEIAANGSKELRNWWSPGDIAGLDVLIVRRIFAQLRMGSMDVAWDELALTFESAVNLKNALKLSRSLVSTAQDSLLHWAAHAQLERMRGRLDESRKVYQTVLIASKPARTAVGFPILWWNWAELEWLAGNDEQCMNIILRSVDLVDSRSGVAVLRAKRGLEDAAGALTPSWNDEVKMKEREAWIKLRALLEILGGKDVAAMLQIFDKYLSSEDHGNPQHESLVTASLIMLYRYGFILKNPTPPAILRERASQALNLYPSNSIILGIFLEGEKGQGVWGRVRELLSDDETGVGRMKDVARRVEEMWIAGWEKGRWKGEIERTRSGLARAVESERTRASPVIWRIYLEFEIRTGDFQKAKKILYRGIGECPLHKDLYLLAFGVLRSVFTSQELNALADLMVERGLRLRKGLDEVMEGWDMDDVQEQDGESSGEGAGSEIEYRAQELRRLMPY